MSIKCGDTFSYQRIQIVGKISRFKRCVCVVPKRHKFYCDVAINQPSKHTNKAKVAR